MSIREEWLGELLGISTIIVSFICAWYLMDYHEFTLSALSVEQEQTFYEVKKGATISSVAADFENNGWISNKNYLKVYTKLNDIGSIKAGEYAINKGLTAIGAIKLFIKGEVILHQITLIEGWTFKQMLEAISKHDKINPTLKELEVDEIMMKLGKPGVHPEGAGHGRARGPGRRGQHVGRQGPRRVRHGRPAERRRLPHQGPREAPQGHLRLPHRGRADEQGQGRPGAHSQGDARGLPVHRQVTRAGPRPRPTRRRSQPTSAASCFRMARSS